MLSAAHGECHLPTQTTVIFSFIPKSSVDHFIAVGEMRHLSRCAHVRAGCGGSLLISSSLRINYITFWWLCFIPKANSTIPGWFCWAQLQDVAAAAF